MENLNTPQVKSVLTDQEQDWLEKLRAKRTNAVNVLKEEGFISIFVSHIVDTYRESAHFIYELLQNADDVKATKARFELRNEGILFAHNGTENFSISDPDDERKEGVTPGHLNSITTFSLSSKKEEIENKIGKFGIGFKSVFQYTDTPHVYNPPYNFKIENYMIPSAIEENLDLFLTGETTVFWLPFNKAEKIATRAFAEISNKLRTLNNPLLFLRNLEQVHIKFNGSDFVFSKKIQPFEPIDIANVEVNRIILNKTSVIRFDKKVNIKDNNRVNHLLPISIGFVIDEDGNVTSENKYSYLFKNAWCFFPTYQQTGLSYILNAPFILTPNREALKEDRIENSRLLNALHILMGEALQGLKTLGFINEYFFRTISDPDQVPADFQPVAKRVVEKLRLGEFIPTMEGDFINVNNAYVSTQEQLNELLCFDSYSPLKRLVNKSKARIVFRNRRIFDHSQFVFIYKTFSAEETELNGNWFGSRYELRFIDGASKEFILMFFRYLARNHSSILSKNQPLWKKKFIRVDRGPKEKLFVSPNDSAGRPQTYITDNKTPDRYTVVDYLKRDEEIRNFLVTILKSKIPDEFDDFILSLKKYAEPEKIDREEIFCDLNTISGFLKRTSQDKKERLITELKKYDFLPVIKGANHFTTNPFSQVVYYPSQDLKEYFSKSKEEKTWLDIPSFKEFESESNFICEELDIERIPYYFSKEDTLDGLQEYLGDIPMNESVYLSTILAKYISTINFGRKLEVLRTCKWLYDKEGNKKLSNQIKEGELHDNYSYEADIIHRQLGCYVDPNEKRYASLNEKERKALEALGDSIDHLSPDEIQKAVSEFLETKKLQRRENNGTENEKKPVTPRGLLESWTKDSLTSNIDEGAYNTTSSDNRLLKPIDFWENDEENEASNTENPGGFVSTSIIGNDYKEDQKRTKQAQLEKELQLESFRHQLIELAETQEPYSFGWFKTLLELEDNFTAEDRIRRNPIRVVFTTAHLDDDGLLELGGTPYIPPHIEDIGEISIQLYFDDQKKTITGEVVSPQKRILKIKLSSPEILKTEDLTKVTRAVVAASSPDFVLEKLKTAFCQLPFEDSDILKSKEVLPKDILFIFGPPGTGKTTYLSWLIGGKNPETVKFRDEEVSPLMIGSNKKVLVLTPTNKAADVLSERILENYSRDEDYPQWLIRFGQTESLENEPIFVGDRLVQPWVRDRCTFITTIARFPYDGFSIQDTDGDVDKWQIKDFDWDYIIFDEASMIQQSAILYTILYASQLNNKVRFIIGGDPFQIPPIIQFEYPYWSYIPDPAYDPDGNPILDENGSQIAWKQDGGNIYSFTGLMRDDSFAKPVSEPHQFAVHNLLTQFRSLPPIGTLFSNYRYGGILKHFRGNYNTSGNGAPGKRFEIQNLPLSSLNIIRFPVKKYEGIYRSRSVQGSPYHIYSAIFSVELIKYIQSNLSSNSHLPYRIGIISPYAVQNTIVSKLLEKVGSGPVEIVTGTVHGFQGDECDLVIVLLNPPRNIKRTVRSFLNKKNILNVAISRARDKMILMVPHDSEGEVNVHDLHQIKHIEYLAGKLNDCKDEVTGYLAEDIEAALWGSNTYIEDNAFHTSHQKVNIYTEAAKQYEIRQDENAVDVQVKGE